MRKMIKVNKIIIHSGKVSFSANSNIRAFLFGFGKIGTLADLNQNSLHFLRKTQTISSLITIDKLLFIQISLNFIL